MNGGMHARVDLETILYGINLYHAEKKSLKLMINTLYRKPEMGNTYST